MVLYSTLVEFQKYVIVRRECYYFICRLEPLRRKMPYWCWTVSVICIAVFLMLKFEYLIILRHSYFEY